MILESTNYHTRTNSDSLAGFKLNHWHLEFQVTVSESSSSPGCGGPGERRADSPSRIRVSELGEIIVPVPCTAESESHAARRRVITVGPAWLSARPPDPPAPSWTAPIRPSENDWEETVISIIMGRTKCFTDTELSPQYDLRRIHVVRRDS
jgi:hypothetical protein